MSKRRLALIVVLFLVAVISLTVMRSRLVGNPEDACAAVPPAGRSKQNPGNVVIQIISPRHGTGVTTVGQLPIVLEVNNFEPKEYLKIALWVDSKLVDTRFVWGTGTVAQGYLADSQKNQGTHNLCLAPIDSRTGEEVGNRVGMRLYLEFRGADEVDFRWIGPCCLIWGTIFVVGALYFAVNDINKQSVSDNLDKMD